MIDFSELEALREMAPEGYYVLPAKQDVVPIIVIGDTHKSVLRDWFAIFPDSAIQPQIEQTLIKIISERIASGA